MEKLPFVFKPQWQGEGEGASVLRIICHKYFQNYDPFLFFEFYKAKLPWGFPDHAHCGFQTVTYSLQGDAYHEDFVGNTGKMGPGDLQWMVAGRGIMHSGMPSSFTQDCIGLQLWVNLSKEHKEDPPAFRAISKDEIQIHEQGLVTVKVITGQWKGKKGPIPAKSPYCYYDVHLLPGGKIDIPVSGLWKSIIFAYKGSLTYQADTFVDEMNVCVLLKPENDAEIVHSFSSQEGARFVFLSGLPLNEPIAQEGPLAALSFDQLEKKKSDILNKTGDFQKAAGWQSKIKQLINGKKYEEL